jgi:D-sedoheptulose 7-phosphate isomerase
MKEQGMTHRETHGDRSDDWSDDWGRGAMPVEIPPTGSPYPEYYAAVVAALAERRTALEAALAEMEQRAGVLAVVADRLITTLCAGGKVLAAGNGGSAAEAQHFTAELVGRFRRERMPYAALSLSTDTSALTAIANDYGYAEVFARQVRALGRPGDTLVAFSTSGESENLVRAARAARDLGITVVAVTGERQSRLGRVADLLVRAPLRETALTQELHMAVTHVLCDIVEQALAAREVEAGLVDGLETGVPARSDGRSDTVDSVGPMEALA